MKVRFIGDVHGKFKHYHEIIDECAASIQVGDMGVGFRKFHGDLVWSPNPSFDKMSKGRHLFIRGNHDNPEVCKNQKYWIQDGSLVNGVYCLGGATSIDRAWRTEGIDWWSDEECSQEDLDRMTEEYAEIKPNIVCTHECPESIANEILSAFNKVKINDKSRTRLALERMFYLHQPKYWVFGHWHHSIQFQRGGTIFQCLNELEFTDVELEDFYD